MVVIDASVTGALMFEDERSPPDGVAAMLLDGPLVAPVHWAVEVSNMILIAERRQRTAPSDRPFLLDQAQALRVVVERDSEQPVWHRVLTLAAEHRLTAYDAAYLELAIRRGARLASLDRRLIEAADGLVDVLTW